MLENLRRVAPGAMHKLVCFATDARCVPAAEIDEAPDICFIDGRHTNEAVLSDFCFCLGVCASDAAIVFHDAGVTRSGIKECMRLLRRSGRAYVSHKLPGNTFVVAIWGSPLGSDPRFRRLVVAVNGERWLLTASVPERARRRVPPALRPAFATVRNRFWGVPNPGLAGTAGSRADGGTAAEVGQMKSRQTT
jgi:hypothetical protein